MDNATKETASDSIWILVEQPKIPGVKDTFIIMRASEKRLMDTASEWQSVITLDQIMADMWDDIEIGDALHLTFTGQFREPMYPGDYLICFFDITTYSPIGVPITVYLDDTYREVFFKEDIFSLAYQSPGTHRLDVNILIWVFTTKI